MKRTRRLAISMALLAALSCLALPAEYAGARDTLVAIIDQAQLIKVPPETVTVVVGNPTIADVTLLRKNAVIVLTPKALGETNFIALDEVGNPLDEGTIKVVKGPDDPVVQRRPADR